MAQVAFVCNRSVRICGAKRKKLKVAPLSFTRMSRIIYRVAMDDGEH